MEYAKIENNIVTQLISTDRIHDEPWVLVDANKGLSVGSDVRMFNDKWELRPLLDLIEDGLVVLTIATEADEGVKPGTVLEKVVDNRIMKKTRYELVTEGAASLSHYEFIEDGEIKLKTDYMLVAEGIHTIPENHYVDHENKAVVDGRDIQDLYNAGKLSEETYQRWLGAERVKLINALLKQVNEAVSNPLRWMDFTSEQQQELATYRRSLLELRKDEDRLEKELPVLSFDLDE